MRFIGQWPGQGVPVNITTERQKALDALRSRGTLKLPQAPRDVIAQSASRGVFLTWGLPQVYFDIVGWRIYRGDENTLFTEIRDRGNRQCFVEATASATSPVTNFFVSSINQLGRESQKVQVQQAAANESNVPANPPTPPGYTNYSVDRSSGTGRIRLPL